MEGAQLLIMLGAPIVWIYYFVIFCISLDSTSIYWSANYSTARGFEKWMPNLYLWYAQELLFMDNTQVNFTQVLIWFLLYPVWFILGVPLIILLVPTYGWLAFIYLFLAAF